MASSNSALSVAQPLIPVFKGESYEFWSIRMKSILKSQDLWDLVECGFVDPNEENKLRGNKAKIAKALVFIQQDVHDSVFSRIATVTTSKQAWTIHKKEFQGDSKVIVVRLQSLQHNFVTLMMKSGESIACFSSRATTIVSQMQSFGEKVNDQIIVENVLRSLTPKFDHVVVAIEESKDLSVFSFDELMGSLQAHETRIKQSTEKNEDKAFQVEDSATKYGENNGPGRGRRGFCGGRGHGYRRGRGRNDGQRKSNDYKKQGRDYLFMACIDTDYKPSDYWFVDSGCSNHMTGVKSLFHVLDEKLIKMVHLGNTKELLVEGKGMVSIDTNQDKVNMIDMFNLYQI
ncbi:uncharacterized protein LOC125823869 [Solanum verrucosum]|uniref:uncharacterized protein LOC125823869 n=1 Tax=Solanum verrucosum TaxID=315347 RepID=UPI0020D12A46|nr:uncharacterized protein LOC125823869 [Solanum verrucosum]